MIEVMKQALEALETTQTLMRLSDPQYVREYNAITSLRQAIAEAEKQEVSQEPVAWLCKPDENGLFSYPTSDKGCKDCFPVFTRPQPKQPLTDVEIADLWDAQLFHIVDLKLAIDFVRDIEAAHGIKEKISPNHIGDINKKVKQEPKRKWVELKGEAYDWDIERCRAYAEQLRDRTRANRAEHAAQAIEWLLAQLASHQIIGKNQEPKREWAGLTSREIYNQWEDSGVPFVEWDSFADIARAIEAKLKEKNA